MPLTVVRYCLIDQPVLRWRSGSNVFGNVSSFAVIVRDAPSFRFLSRPRPSLALGAIDGRGVFLRCDVIIPKVQWTIDEVYSQCLRLSYFIYKSSMVKLRTKAIGRLWLTRGTSRLLA